MITGDGIGKEVMPESVKVIEKVAGIMFPNTDREVVIQETVMTRIGTIGIAPSANINPEGNFPSLFEPVHGSAPDIAGKGIANPIGQIQCGGMMLEHLGYSEAGAEILQAIEKVLSLGVDNAPLTGDLGGTGITFNWVRLLPMPCNLSPTTPCSLFNQR